MVAYAVKRRVAAGEPDYCEHATLLEVAVLGKNLEKAEAAGADGLAAASREGFGAETTARNLRLIGEIREHRGEAIGWRRTLDGPSRKRARS